MRSSVPPGQNLLAVVIAAAVTCGLFLFFSYRTQQSASAASLSFDSATAQQLDSGLARTPYPAAVFGQSILSDSFIARVVSESSPAASSTPFALGEFRARLQLTQPNDATLLIRYRDADSSRAIDVANAVAQALVAWAPSTANGPRTAANPPAPVPAPKLAPAPAQGPKHAATAEPSLAAALGQLLAQLSAADQGPGSGSSRHSAHDQQRYLESQVRAAQQKVHDLRSEFAGSRSVSGAPARLDVIQHALALFWPQAAGLNPAGTSKKQLDYEREQLSRDIALVQEQQQDALRDEASDSAPATHPVKQTAPEIPQPQSASDSTQSAAAPPASSAPVNPLRLERLAGPPAPVLWWPLALIGCSCGLLYWGLAFALHRSSSETEEPLEDAAPSIYSLNNTEADLPASSRVRDRFRGEWADIRPRETSSLNYASTTPASDSIPAPVADPSTSTEPIQAPATDAVLENLSDPASAPTHTHTAETVSGADAVAPPQAQERQNNVPSRNSKAADSWSDKVRRDLSQTTIGRVMDEPAGSGETPPSKSPTRNGVPPASEPDRLAG